MSDPAMAIQIAMIKAGSQPFTSKPRKSLSANFIITAETINLTTNVNKPRVRILSGSRKRKPIVAFKIPITRATPIAVA